MLCALVWHSFLFKIKMIDSNLCGCWCNWPWIKDVSFAFITSMVQRLQLSLRLACVCHPISWKGPHIWKNPEGWKTIYKQLETINGIYTRKWVHMDFPIHTTNCTTTREHTYWTSWKHRKKYINSENKEFTENKSNNFNLMIVTYKLTLKGPSSFGT